ncbi:FAD-dependent monooxygenase [Serratia ureilytica]
MPVIAARGRGIDVTVLEKHADFLRDFRGDTIHPSTLEVMHQLGLLDEPLAPPHQRAESLHAESPGADIAGGFSPRLPTRCKFIAFGAPREFLNFWHSRPPRSPISGCSPRRFISCSTTAAHMRRAGRHAGRPRSAYAASW